jgi:hypothetical protein
VCTSAATKYGERYFVVDIHVRLLAYLHIVRQVVDHDLGQVTPAFTGVAASRLDGEL